MKLLHRNGLMVKLHCPLNKMLATRLQHPGVETFSEHPASGQPSTREGFEQRFELLPPAVNRTKVEAGLQRLARSVCWANFFHGKDPDREEVEPVSLLKKKKTNFPPSVRENKYEPSTGVREFITCHPVWPPQTCVTTM